MIHTDGIRTIANAEPRAPQIPGQMTLQEVIAQMDCDELEELLEHRRKARAPISVADSLDENWPPADPIYGGF
jgi:hypothetical protein